VILSWAEIEFDAEVEGMGLFEPVSLAVSDKEGDSLEEGDSLRE
jgi:hypothetical protein